MISSSRLRCRSALVALLGLLTPHAGWSATRLSTASGEKLYEIVDAALADDPAEPSIDERLAGELVLVFIPGILGSGLHGAGGESIWGEGVPQVSRLALTAGDANAARTSVLAEYPLGLVKADVYGDFDTNFLSIDGSRRALEFSYDWRLDIDSIADSLEAKIRGPWADQLRGKRLLIIAHSMGGLVAWSWKNRHYEGADEEYDFEWYRLLLLGSPLGGSCDTMRMLLTGYSPGGKTRMAPLYEKVFGDLRAAAFTFPSIYQLLPVYDGASTLGVCLKVQAGGRNPQDHFSIDVWKGLLRPFVADEKLFGTFRFWGWVGEDAVWQKLGMAEAAFWRMVDGHLETARRFRAELDLDEGDSMRGRVSYFFSNGHATTEALIFERDSTELEPQTGDGDGRVLKPSATLERYAEGHAHPLSLTHGDLPSDVTFLRHLEGLLEQLKYQVTARVAATKHEVRQALVERRLLLQMSPEDWTDSGDPEAFASLAAFNRAALEVLAAERPDLAWDGTSAGMLRLVSALEEEAAIDPGAERALLELAWHGGARGGADDQVLLAQRLARSLEQAAIFAPAAQVARAGLDTLRQAPGTLGLAYERDLTFRLGSSLEAVGAEESAGTAYRRAFQLAEIEASAAAPGAEEAMVWLGRHYFQGRGVERDPETAVDWYERAAAVGNPWGKANLAQLTLQMANLKQQPERAQTAAELFEQALASSSFIKTADAGYIGETYWNLGVAQKALGRDPQNQFRLADEKLRLAWDAGDPKAAVILGRMYQRGDGLQRDVATAESWYLRASLKGQVPAMLALAELYDGEELPGGKAAALSWYVNAAGRGEPGAMLQSGYRFQTGLGTVKDPDRAAFWYRRALAAGVPEAKTYLEDLGLSPIAPVTTQE